MVKAKPIPCFGSQRCQIGQRCEVLASWTLGLMTYETKGRLR